ncbi:MAG: ComEC/Rec2 family competence protein [Tepidisphaeraceae bacterium]
MPQAPSPTRRWTEWVSRRPAVPAAVAFIAGIVCHDILPHRPGVWLVMLALLVAMAVIAFGWSIVCSASIAGALFLAGVAAAQVEALHYPDRHISLYATDTPRLAQLELYLDRPPRVLSYPYGQLRALPPRQVATARVTRVKTWDGWVDASGSILVQIDQPHPRLAQGQRVEVLGMLQRPAPAMNPGQLDWASYYRDQRILASLQVRHADNLRVVGVESSGPIARLRESSRRLLAAGFAPRQSLDHALLRALLLGDSDPQLRDVQEQFQRTGTSHHLAISGLHVAVLGGFVLGICRLFCLPPRRSAILMTAFVVLYGVAALPSAPVIRSVLLCLAFGLGLIFRRSLDAVQLLALSVLAMLVIHPLDLYNAGFQLSFLTVLGLMLLTDAMVTVMSRLRDRDAASFAPPPNTLRPSRAREVGHWLDRTLLTALGAGVVAWLVSFPLIAWHFEQLNLWAIPASLALAPLVFAALILGLMKVVLTVLWPGLAATWVALCAWPITWMRESVDWMARLPLGDVPLPAPSVWLAATWYVLLGLCLHRRIRAPGIRWWAGGACAISGLAIIVFPYHTRVAQPASARDELRVTFLAVGAGQCAVVEPPSGRTVLIDAGSTSLSDLLRKCLGPYLRTRGRTRIDTVVLSHSNLDHFSAAGEVAGAYGVHEVLVGPHFRVHATDNPPAEMMLKQLDDADRPPRVIAPGDVIPFGRHTGLEVLWPPPDCAFDANNTSLVLRLTHAGRTILFTGDVQDDAMRELLKSPEKLKADVLVAPHHGSSESATAAFVRAVDPARIISSNDRTLTRKQKDFEGMIGGRPLRRTHMCGAVTVCIANDGALKVETFLENGRPRTDR